MKIRNGFVSNSSSSSFIVFFKDVPKTVEELQQMLFGDDTVYHGYTVEEVAKTVFFEMTEMCSREDVMDQIQSYWGQNDALPELKDFAKCGIIVVADYDKALQKWVDKVIADGLPDGVGATPYLFSYSDEDGDFYGWLRHGGLFSKLPHFTVSD